MKKKNVVTKSIVFVIILLFVASSFVGAMTIKNTDGPKKYDLVEVIDQQQIQDCGYGFSFFNENWLAQGFIPRIPSLTKVEVFVFKSGDPPPDVQLTMYIRMMANGENLASCTVDASKVPNGPGGWIEFDFPDTELTTDWLHHIVLRASGGSSGNGYYWLFGIDNPYPVGEAKWSYTSGYVWEVLNPEGYPHPDCCFKTYGLEQPPTMPTIEGPAKGKVGESTRYYFNASDPDGIYVQYMIDWGDGQTTGWTGDNGSGSPLWLDHTWETRGSYIIRAKVRDKQLAESDWGTLPIQMPFSFNLPRHRLFERFFERFPNAFPLLQKMRG